MSLVAGVDLVKYPDRALDLTNAIPIMFVGMKQGIFTGKKFADFFKKANRTGSTLADHQWLHKAQLIASYAKKYYSAISYTT